MTLILQDQAALIRSTTASVLAAANTIAGDRVQQERVDEVADGDTPRIIVFADQSAQTNSQAGSALTFLVTLNMVIQALVQDAQLDGAVAKLDTLTAQIKTALFENPAFTILMQVVSTFRVTSSFKSGSAYILGDARVLITGTWYETYNPNLAGTLATVRVTSDIGHAPTLESEFNPPSGT